MAQVLQIQGKAISDAWTRKWKIVFPGLEVEGLRRCSMF
ncbi:MAG: hypothetical protein A4E47_01436 [Methanosaeta sp. PtaU1.Bin028]|nr:MAG: hypothetical protein A4E47_01436 [Methanosaeta sp. PtaU1.Bin028]